MLPSVERIKSEGITVEHLVKTNQFLMEDSGDYNFWTTCHDDDTLTVHRDYHCGCREHWHQAEFILREACCPDHQIR